MSVQIVIDFLTEVGKNITLQEKLEQITTAEELIRFARQLGYHASEEDFIAATWQLKSEFESESESEELSSSQLTMIAGGVNVYNSLYQILNIPGASFSNRVNN